MAPSGYPSNAAYPAALDPLTPKVTADDGGDFSGLLQPKHQHDNVATLTATNVTSTTLVATTINAIIDTLIDAGIMKAS